MGGTTLRVVRHPAPGRGSRKRLAAINEAAATHGRDGRATFRAASHRAERDATDVCGENDAPEGKDPLLFRSCPSFPNLRRYTAACLRMMTHDM